MDQLRMNLRKDVVHISQQFKKVPDSHTTLSSYIWKLKGKGICYEVKWSIKGTCFLKWRPIMQPVPN